MLLEPDRYSIEYICLNLRACDKREIFAMRPHDSPVRLAHEAWYLVTTQGRGAVAWHDGKPAALIALIENWPGVWDAMAFGTDAWRNVAIELMRWGRANVRQVIEDLKGHRLQADSHVDSVDSHRFLRALGAEPEAVLRGYGKDNSDFIRFSWVRKTREDWTDVLRWRGQQQQERQQAEVDQPRQGGPEGVPGPGRGGAWQGLPQLPDHAQRSLRDGDGHAVGGAGRVLAADDADACRWMRDTLRGE